GPALPRRDREDTLHRHARLMLILFQPWRCAADLRLDHESWVGAYNAWMEDPDSTYEQKRRHVDNIQSIHECRDARD
ncbi:hypothetical protein L210DRAFT_3361032, partial [Boletus edulis BED1]